MASPRKVTKLQREKLQSYGLPIPETSEEAKKMILDHLDEIVRTEPVTDKQAAYIRDFGFPVPPTKLEASALLDKLTKGPTPKQRAKLEFLGIDTPESKEKACYLLDEVENDPHYLSKLIKWDRVKRKLHPNLYKEGMPGARNSEDSTIRIVINPKIPSGSGCLVVMALGVFLGVGLIGALRLINL